MIEKEILEKYKETDRILEDLRQAIYNKKEATFSEEEARFINSIYKRADELRNLCNFVMKANLCKIQR
ncbi:MULTISPECIES: hypothetical protein [unclassified Nitratiruptor]|uniref:hypothetical protein n=1 Tax=unclassified Nitratiruptor TaxID=2624044 RepID=UPI001914F3CB|nr:MULTISPECIES: hypothetical protein [unclassified Nitratiruptor]BCD59606.1 hypothetical protein NitYY0810_C0357 [Nitratiruptor sp. YY08-10]BCD63530.1 hypothetical protein NitYY0814_C0357 [Nitratiruptor sp. YY08-14]BCD83082.1 hypothetical protein NrS2_32 [Nitratiruptor phage NrS-2]BCD83148.1 hypothetical protein NrS3_32 [Nitratiruptor phage NrS-3]